MSIYKGTTLLAGGIVTPHLDTRNVGQIIPSTLPLTDAGLHLLDGSLLSGDGIYSEFVTYIAQLVNSHPELFTTEADWQTSVTSYGVCGKFVYDSANNTVRLPKKSSTERHLVKSTVDGTSWCDVYSDGWCEQGDYVANSGSENTNYVVTLLRGYSTTDYSVTITFDRTGNNTANMWGFVHNNSTTQFQLVKMGQDFWWRACGYTDVSGLEQETIYPYIVIANSTKTEIEVDIDEIATDLNGKADVDLSNVSSNSGFRKLITSYRQGSSWYKVFAEYDSVTGRFIGYWCEQGGLYDNGSNARDVNTTITFLQPFAGGWYEFSFIGATSTGNHKGAVGATNKTATGIEIGFYGFSSSDYCRFLYWKAEGWLAADWQPS